MTQLNKQVKFRMSGINIDQFAILTDEEPKDGVSLEMKIGVAANKEAHRVLETLRVVITSNDEQHTPYVILQVSCAFEIEQSDWDNFADGKRIVIPRNLLVHFAVHVMGTARGILFAKTENTIWNSLILPPHNVEQMFTDDLVLE